eukprot:jgi/Undpi1/7178/HiC_scaffold_22.g09652.m1
MGTASSKSDDCMTALCGRKDDAYVGSECPLEENARRNDDNTRRESLCSAHDKMAPSTGEEFPLAKRFASPGCGSVNRSSDKRPFSSVWSEPWASTPPQEDLLSLGSVLDNPRNSLMRETPEAEMGEGAVEGLKSFFHSGRDELIEDTSWSHTKHGPSLAELLQRIETLGNVDEAMSHVRSVQDREDRSEEVIRAKVIRRFMQVMGPDAPGLAVKKCHRSSGGGNSNGAERGKWAARTITFDINGAEMLPDGTPLGGAIVWNSKRLFPREKPGIKIADISRVEHNDQFLWMMADGEGRLGFETSSSADARFLCRSIDFLVSAVVQHSNVGRSRSSTKTASLQSIGTNQHVYPPPPESWPQGPQGR